MSEPFLSEIRIFGFNFAPRGWAKCDHQLLPISQNHSLYALLGTTYGGDGRTTFALPMLRGRTPIGEGDEYILGAGGGSETVALTVQEMPSHKHTVIATSTAGSVTDRNPTNAFPAGGQGINALPYAYEEDPDASLSQHSTVSVTLTQFNENAVTRTGANIAHNNMQPFLTLSYCIAIQGLYPSRP